jgi:hypothetical protein
MKMNDPSPITSWFETAILGRTDLDVTQRRRRIFLALSVAVAVPAILIPNFSGESGPTYVETMIDSLLVAVLIANVILIRFLRTGKWLYRLDALIIGVAIPYFLTLHPGDDSRVLWSFVFPLFFIFLLGKGEGLIWTGLFLVAGAFVLLTDMAYLSPETQVRFLVTFSVCTVLAYTIESLRERFDNESRALIGRLEKALSEVKTLERLLPICANCKKIRDDTGYWNQIEAYLQEHADTRFTHSVCPECVQKLYPEFVERYMEDTDNGRLEESEADHTG